MTEPSQGRVINWLQARTSRQRWVLALLCGAVSVLAMPPFGWWPVLALTLPGLVLLLDAAAALGTGRQRWRHAGTLGWWFGFGYFLPGLYWIGSAFLVEAERFAWLMPFAVTAMPAGLALFYAAATASTMLIWRPGLSRVLVLALALAIAEWLRATQFTGFPWNALGYALTAQSSLAQSASLIGVHGLTLFTVGLLATPVLILQIAPWPVRFGPPAAAALVLIMAAIWGAARVPTTAMPVQPGIVLTLVQPNTPEREKFLAEAQHGIFKRLLELSAAPILATVSAETRQRIIIWPETPVNALMLDEPPALAAIADRIGSGNLLITGALRRSPRGTGFDYYNALAVIDSRGQQIALYDKAHLVPFGEYLPFQQTLEAIGFESLTRQRGGFATGPGVRTLAVPGVPPFSPLICYEVIFPGAVVDRAHRPAWLLNITNDAWFGVSTGPYQHLQQARVRAIEEGLPMVRVAGTGISAIFDGYGRTVVSLPLEEQGTVTAELPQPLPPTLYAQAGNTPFAGLCVLTMLLIWLVLPRRLSPAERA